MKKTNIFWVGYSDLMTSMFFIMLVLFVVTIGYLKNQMVKNEKLVADSEMREEYYENTIDSLEIKNDSLHANMEQFNKIQELQTAVQQLPSKHFEYQPRYKRFKLKKQIEFDTDKAYIKPKYHNDLIEVGQSIKELISNLENNEEYKKLDIKYLVVIEGMASIDPHLDNDIHNFKLSYKRALALYKFWEANGIVFDPESCEIQIAGSGTEGVREYKGFEEKKNQQILIHIIPKMGEIPSGE